MRSPALPYPSSQLLTLETGPGSDAPRVSYVTGLWEDDTSTDLLISEAESTGRRKQARVAWRQALLAASRNWARPRAGGCDGSYQEGSGLNICPGRCEPVEL